MRYHRSLSALLLLATPALSAPIRVLGTARTPVPTVVGPEVELATPRAVASGSRTHRYYPQQIAGTPVLGCGVDEIVEADGSSTLQSATLCATTGLPASVDAATASAAARAAVAQMQASDRFVVATPEAAYRPNGSPVWVVDVATSSPWNVFRVFVDATTGRVTRLASRVRDMRGYVFPKVDSVKGHAAAMKRLRGLDPDAETLAGDDFTVDDVSDFLALCDGTESYFCDPPESDACAARAKGHAFHYSPKAPLQIGSCTTNDRFDQVTAYYHLAEMAAYFRTLGYDPGTGALSGWMPLPVLVNVPYFLNAYFAPPSNTWPAHMAFGDESTGARLNDFTNDPTVPRHEFTHAVVFDAAGGINDDDTCIGNCSPYAGAMNEGFADYFAIQSLGGKQTVVGSQLGAGIANSVERDIDNDLRFPCDLSSEVHADGRLWSSFLRDVKQIIGKDFDAAVVRSIANIPHGLGYSLGFSEAFEAVLDELPELTPKQHLAVVETATRKGVIGAFAKDRGGNATIDTGGTAWTCAPGNVCDTYSDEALGIDAASIVTNGGFAGGLAAHLHFEVTSPLDLRAKQLLHFQMFASPTPTDGELKLAFDNNQDCSSPEVILDLPAFDSPGWTERFIQFTNSDLLANVTCIGLLAPAGSHSILVDRIDTGESQFGPVVLPIDATERLTIKNHFPLPLGDSHFYYFIPPTGASTVTVRAQAQHETENPGNLRYCGSVRASGAGKVPPQIITMHLWTYDPTQPHLPFQVTMFTLDSHQLIAGIPEVTRTTRRAKDVDLPLSPTGVYAVSIEGSGDYTIKLSFE